jgi:hypothetical protein
MPERKNLPPGAASRRALGVGGRGRAVGVGSFRPLCHYLGKDNGHGFCCWPPFTIDQVLSTALRTADTLRQVERRLDRPERPNNCSEFARLERLFRRIACRPRLRLVRFTHDTHPDIRGVVIGAPGTPPPDTPAGSVVTTDKTRNVT